MNDFDLGNVEAYDIDDDIWHLDDEPPPTSHKKSRSRGRGKAEWKPLYLPKTWWLENENHDLASNVLEKRKLRALAKNTIDKRKMLVE